ncbi:MAG: flagellar biosynthesis protein FlhB [candidate division FCPU426 bacterium]
MADSNKTEPCTPKKRRDARERGEVARSVELSAAINLLTGFALSALLAGYFGRQSQQMFESTAAAITQGALNEAALTACLRGAGQNALGCLLPVLAVVLIVTLLTGYLQVGFHMTPKVLNLNLNKLNPIMGAKRLFSLRPWVELIKSLLKLGVAGIIVWLTVKEYWPRMLPLLAGPLSASLLLVGSLLWSIFWKLGLFFLLIGAADFAWQRFDFERKMRMTKQEVRDEYRQNEGDAQVRSLRRSRHRRLSQNRLAVAVAKADVVTTNPTHYAVALRYEQRRMRAPKVVAKGERLWAKMIVRLARRHQVPVVENKVLTRALFKSVEVGREIPPSLYRAVAELLAMIYRLRSARRNRP